MEGASDSGAASASGGKYLVDFDSRLSAEEQKIFFQLVSLFRESSKYREVRGLPQARSLSRLLLEKLPSGKRLSAERASLLADCAAHSIAGFGCLDFLLAQEELEEVSVIGVGEPAFVFHRQLGWLETNCFIASFDYAVECVNKMARPLGRRLSYQTPRLNATLEDGSRLHATMAPLCRSGVEMSIRKFSREPVAIPSIVSSRCLSAEAAAALWLALYSDLSLVVAGNSGGGKTTLLNALFGFVPLNERVVAVEETPEIALPHKHFVRLVCNPELGVSLKHLALDTLRMRPDRLIVGEVRSSEESQALFDCLLSGQARGTYCTFHAKSGQEALSRFKSLGAREDELSAIDLIIVQKRLPFLEKPTESVVVNGATKTGVMDGYALGRTARNSEKRRVTQICFNDGGKLVDLFKLNFASDSLEQNSKGLHALFEKISPAYSLSPKELVEEMSLRALAITGFVSSAAGAGDGSSAPGSFGEFARFADSYAFGKKPVVSSVRGKNFSPPPRPKEFEG